MKLPPLLHRILYGVPEGGLYGAVAQFRDPAALLGAAEALRKAGYRKFEAHSPFPIHGMDRAVGSRGSLVPFLVLGGGLAGGLGGLALQYFVLSVDYPLVISGKPYFPVPAFIPVTFELTVLLASFGAVLGMLVLNRLPMLYHPLFKHEAFARASQDGFFISVPADDRPFDANETRRLLESLGGYNIALVEP